MFSSSPHPSTTTTALNKVTQTLQVMRLSRTIPKPRLVVSVPPSGGGGGGTVLPRRIAPGVFFVNPCDDDNSSSSSSSSDNDNGASTLLPSTHTLANLDITHAVVQRGSSSSHLSGRCWHGMKLKALFVGPQDPLSRVVAWMRAVRSRLGASVIVVGDFAAAAGYLVVELGLTPRSAWLRIARGIPPAGDLVLARLYALAIARDEKGGEQGVDGSALDKGGCAALDGGHAGGGGRPQGLFGSISSRSSRRTPQRVTMTRGESGLKHVVGRCCTV